MSGSRSAQKISEVLSRQRFPGRIVSHVPSAAPVLILYRSLLREISYLPPAIRTEIQKPLVERFRKDKSKPYKHGQLQRGDNALRRIRSANAGDTKSMNELIQRAFGRKGSQRYDLMQHLLPDSTIERIRKRKAGEKTGPEEQTIIDDGTRRFAYEKFDKDKVMALMLSQKASQNQLIGSTSWGSQSINPKKYYPENGLSIWGKPMHAKPLQRKEQRFWDESLARVYPPVDKATWDRMASLVEDSRPPGEPWAPARRTPARHLSEAKGDDEVEDWNWEKFSKHATARVEASKRPRQQRRSGATPLGPYGMAKVMKPVSQRVFRRSLKRTWLSTPYMEEKNGKTSFHFAKKETTPARPTELQAAMLMAMKEPEKQKSGKRSKK